MTKDYSPKSMAYARISDGIRMVQNQQMVMNTTFDKLKKADLGIAPCDTEAELNRLRNAAIAALCNCADVLSETNREIAKNSLKGASE